MTAFGRQTIALLDHAGVEQAVIGGTSLGANVTLEAAARGARARQGHADRDAGAGQRAARLRAGVHAAARRPHLRGAGRARVGAARAARAARQLAARRHAARLGEPGPEAVGVGAAGAVLRPRGAAARGARPDEQQHARDRPLPRPDPPLLRLRHARARAAERAAARGVVDPRAAPHAGAADQRDRRLRRGVLQAAPRRPGRVAAAAREPRAAPGRGGRRLKRPLRAFHYSSPPCRTAESRRRRCGASARSASVRRAPRSSERSWSATAPAGVLALAVARRAGRARHRRRRTAAAATPQAAEVFPDGGSFPEQKLFEVAPAAKAAGCQLKSVKGSGVGDPHDLARRAGQVQDQPAHHRPPLRDPGPGRHLRRRAARTRSSCTGMEHGRVIFWVKPTLPEDQRADIRALVDDDTYQMFLVPRTQHALRGGGHRLERRPAAGRNRPPAALQRGQRQDLRRAGARSATSTARRDPSRFRSPARCTHSCGSATALLRRCSGRW